MHPKSPVRLGLLLVGTGIIYACAASNAASIATAETPSLRTANAAAVADANGREMRGESGVERDAARADARLVYFSGYLLSSGRKTRQRK